MNASKQSPILIKSSVFCLPSVHIPGFTLKLLLHGGLQQPVCGGRTVKVFIFFTLKRLNHPPTCQPLYGKFLTLQKPGLWLRLKFHFSRRFQTGPFVPFLICSWAFVPLLWPWDPLNFIVSFSSFKPHPPGYFSHVQVIILTF